jgi:hypothetical protein
VTWLAVDRIDIDRSATNTFLHLGLGAVAQYSPSGQVRYRSRPESYIAPYVIDTGTIDADRAVTVGAEAAWVRGRLSLQLEALRSMVDPTGGGRLSFGGAYALASWFLTDDSRPYDRKEGRMASVVPQRAFAFGPEGGWGAVEAVARLALGVVTAVADRPGTLAGFRDASRREKNAHRDTLERVLPAAPVEQRVRWGMSTRADAGEPSAPVVVRVVPDSPLERAGLRCGDRIIAIDGEPFATQATMLQRMASAGDALTLQIDRAGRILEVQVVSGGAPASTDQAPAAPAVGDEPARGP